MAQKILTVVVTGSEKLKATLAKFGAAQRIVLADALREEAEDLMDRIKDSQPGKGVPHDRGALSASGHVGEPTFGAGTVRIEVGFGGASAPYALAIHENPRAGKTGGTSPSGRKYQHWAKVGAWKYLEKPLTRLQATLCGRLSARIKREWAALLGG